MAGISETSLRELEAELVQLKARMDVLVDGSPLGIFFDDAEDKCVFVNRTFCQMTGLSPDEALDDGWTRTVHPDDLGRLMAERARAVAEGALLFRTEYRYVRGEGPFGWVEEQTRPVLDPNGKLLGYVGTLAEISDRKEKEHARQRYREELESRVKARTAELESQTSRLAEMNAALKVLLHQRDEDRDELEQCVLVNVRHRLAPTLARLQAVCTADAAQDVFVEVRQGLDELTKPFCRRLSVASQNLTPAEIQVADLIRQGLTTKEIAARLGVGAATIDSHRYHIRRKLKLDGRNSNLRAYLLSLAQR